MSRTPVAALAIITFVGAWISAASVVGDYLHGQHWAVQFVYYSVAGFAWVFPVRWLMLWGARLR